jgi:hypothetical protein
LLEQGGSGGNSITVDTELDISSSNPIANKTVTVELDTLKSRVTGLEMNGGGSDTELEERVSDIEKFFDKPYGEALTLTSITNDIEKIRLGGDDEFESILSLTTRVAQLEQNGGGVTDYNDLENKPTFKTINGQSILGSGNIQIEGGGTGGGDSNKTSYLHAFEFFSGAYGTYVIYVPLDTPELQGESFLKQHADGIEKGIDSLFHKGMFAVNTFDMGGPTDTNTSSYTVSIGVETLSYNDETHYGDYCLKIGETPIEYMDFVSETGEIVI